MARPLIALLVGSLVAVASAAGAPDFKLDQKVKDGRSVEFLSHSGPGPWDSYMTLNLPFEPMAELFKQLLLKERRPLTSRGEAHVTVVTPVEFWNVLKPKGVTMAEIEEIAKTMRIQEAKFDVVCLGRGTAKVDGKDEHTYYVVVNSPDLVAIRIAIRSLFVKKGGKASDFDPKAYHPHITLGFTKRDLHESDGVVKDRKSCVASL